MRQTFMKQFALAISAALVVASTGCAKQGDPPGATLAVDMAYSYKGEQIGGAADALAPTSHGSTAADQILAHVAGHLVIQRGGRLYAFDPDADGMTPLELPDVTECYYSIILYGRGRPKLNRTGVVDRPDACEAFWWDDHG